MSTYMEFPRMRVAEAMDHALEHTRQILFRPFDVSVWLCLGVFIFLDVLLQSDNAFQFFWRRGERTLDAVTFHEGIQEAFRYLDTHFALAVGLAIVGIFVTSLLIVLSSWLRSRGQLMLVRAVALQEYRVDDMWHATRALSRSLFVFTVLVRFLALVFSLFAAAIALTILHRLSAQPSVSWMAYAAALAPVLAMIAVGGVSLWIVNFLLRNFVVPLMYHFRADCLEAWRIFLEIAGGNLGAIFLYAVIRIVIFLLAGIAGFLFGCFTCFIGYLPIIHQAFLAPFYVFDRSLSMFLIESLGPEYRMIRQDSERNLFTEDFAD